MGRFPIVTRLNCLMIEHTFIELSNKLKVLAFTLKIIIPYGAMVFSQTFNHPFVLFFGV
jgi:hypothetical protein